VPHNSKRGLTPKKHVGLYINYQSKFNAKQKPKLIFKVKIINVLMFLLYFSALRCASGVGRVMLSPGAGLSVRGEARIILFRGYNPESWRPR